MKRSKYTYGLIVLSLLLSGSLQVVWLRQLFAAQQSQLNDEIEHLVSTTVQTQWYFSIYSSDKPQNIRQVRQFFLSPQWEQLRQAFDNMKAAVDETGLTSDYRITSDDDSTSVTMKFNLNDMPMSKRNQVPRSYHSGRTPAQLRARDSVALTDIKRDVAVGLRQLGITSAVYYSLYTHDMKTVRASNRPGGLHPAFVSKQYAYGIQNRYRYQVCVPSTARVVWYRMRYYVASSLLMILLTCTAFYVILKLLRNQQLYADAKADFTSNMTHEFKTPIATVSLALESIKKYNLVNDPETLKNYLDISQHELRRLDLMVEKVLNISTATDTNQPLKLELYDVQSGLQRVISSMQVQLANRHAGIRFTASEEPCFVSGDPVHLTNIFYNLIDNAIKYAGDGLAMDISCQCDADKVTLRFKDNGPGIDKLYHKSIFEKFFRVPTQGETHAVKGSGLGLHYVKQIVEKHGGTINISSEPGAGTLFTTTFPAVP